jgi:predicted secreted protein
LLSRSDIRRVIKLAEFIAGKIVAGDWDTAKAQLIGVIAEPDIDNFINDKLNISNPEGDEIPQVP